MYASLISLSFSIYSASSAKTLDKWMYDSTYYQHGADLVVHEYVISSGDAGLGGGSSSSTLSDHDLNITAHTRMAWGRTRHYLWVSIDSISPVLRSTVWISQTNP